MKEEGNGWCMEDVLHRTNIKYDENKNIGGSRCLYTLNPKKK